MGTKIATTINAKGPFFTKDPAKTFRQNIRVLMDELAEAGESDVKAQLRSGEGGRFPLGGGIRPGRVSGHVVGRTSNLSGKRWQVTAVVSVNNRGFSKVQAVKLMAAASWLERTVRPFRRTTQRLRRLRSGAEAALLKGLQ